MPADRIEREIDIEAPIDVVWAVITEPEHINGWFTDAVEVEIRPGSEGRLRWDANDKRSAHTVNLRVERLERATGSLGELASTWDRRLMRIKQIAEASISSRGRGR